MPETDRIDRILRTHEVLETISVSRSTLWRMVRDERFPPPIRIVGRHIGWRLSEVEAWIADRPRV